MQFFTTAQAAVLFGLALASPAHPPIYGAARPSKRENVPDCPASYSRVSLEDCNSFCRSIPNGGDCEQWGAVDSHMWWCPDWPTDCELEL
ncbi:Uu.00g084120.m01.CDS01 [Anthostomella pinea]|uniref:Uu.00g084120.m01.CDS01 n=1 Tax=Anthostomella pinea TaxID=933095 RepID=A0AAI8VMM0_9PEZI|nr:Uu.00g084120.m01.CDS01 [Anthostomella pinea]